MATEYPNVPQEEAAMGQLETAIELWFHERDKPSVHTLAFAAQGILANIARERRTPRRSYIQQFIATKPQRFRAYMRGAGNYFKHGNPKLKHYHPRHSEVIILDSIAACNHLFGRVSPLMVLFLARIALTDEISELLPDQIKAKLLNGLKIEELAALDRKAFFQVALPLLVGD